MEPQAPNPGDIAPPPVAEPAAPTAPQQPASGSEPDNNPSPAEPAMVPSNRLREETEKRRQAEDRIAELEASQQSPTSQITDDELDPDVEELIRKGAKKLGLVSKEELEANQNLIQVQQDVADLTANPPNPGIPYDNKAVMEYAKSNNMPITSKTALRAAYREMNYDKIVEAERQRAIDGYKKAGSSGAEQPGSRGSVEPVEPELTSKTPKERTRERIRNARQKLTI